MTLLTLMVLMSSLSVHTLAQDNEESENNRCKSICPPYPNISGYIYKRNVSEKDCNCFHMVHPKPVPGPDVVAYYLLCECEYEEQSTDTLEFIIIFYLAEVGALLYMAFLVLVDPLVCKRQSYVQPLLNEEETEEARVMAAAADATARANTVLERVEGAQQRWKQQVQEQRKTVFDRHKMLSKVASSAEPEGVAAW